MALENLVVHHISLGGGACTVDSRILGVIWISGVDIEVLLFVALTHFLLGNGVVLGPR